MKKNYLFGPRGRLMPRMAVRDEILRQTDGLVDALFEVMTMDQLQALLAQVKKPKRPRRRL